MIRNFAKSLENWLINSMSEMPSEIVNIKVSFRSILKVGEARHLKGIFEYTKGAVAGTKKVLFHYNCRIFGALAPSAPYFLSNLA